MLLSIPLQPGTVLSSVRFRWIVGGVEQAEQSSGISQPDANFPLFLFTVVPPANAEEIVAYDVTDLSNWNVGQYELFAPGPPPGPPIIITAPFPAPSGLRTTRFGEVYDSILRRHGLDPLVQTEHDVLRAIVEHVNDRLETAWSYWEWPQLQLLQQRAFRTVWTNSIQFYQTNAEGIPDECYNPGDQLYYRVLTTALTDPPVGTLPTDTNYFEPFDLTDRYILLDQLNSTPIGDVVAIFDTDPRINANHYATKLPFRPMDREITVTWSGTGPTVWVLFRISPANFSAVPYMTGKTYSQGDTIFHPTDRECYQANQDSPTGDPTAQPLQWTKVGFPSIFRRYVVAGAYADGLRETDPSENDPVKLQIRNTKIQIADAEADDYLQQEIDRLVTAGQVYRYGDFNPVRWWRTHARYW
jgi:hypothetical protein